MMSLAMILFQDVSVATHDVHLMRWFAGIIAAAMVAQAIGVLLAASYAAKFLMKMDKLSKSFEERTTPILSKTNLLIDELGPKVRSITSNVEEISYTVRAKVDEVGETVSQVNTTVTEMNSRTRRQVSRVDGLVTEALDTTQDVSRTVQEGIRVPVRQIAGIVAGVKAGIEVLVARFPWLPKKDDAEPGPYDL